jgi:hypothetical protein
MIDAQDTPVVDFSFSLTEEGDWEVYNNLEDESPDFNPVFIEFDEHGKDDEAHLVIQALETYQHMKEWKKARDA